MFFVMSAFDVGSMSPGTVRPLLSLAAEAARTKLSFVWSASPANWVRKQVDLSLYPSAWPAKTRLPTQVPPPFGIGIE